MVKENEEELISKILARYSELKIVKDKWNVLYQQVGKYINIRKQDFTDEQNEGDFLTAEIFDTTAVFALRTMAAALVGALFPKGEKTFCIEAPKDLRENKEVKEYFEWVTDKMSEYMGMREAGLALSLDEYMLDAGSFGWGGIMLYDDKQDTEIPVKYANWGPKCTYIDEDSFGFVNTVYYMKKKNVFDAARVYGKEKLSEKAREAIEKGKISETVNILVAIQPREYIEAGKLGNKNAKYAAYHIDVDSKILLKESGFDYLPTTIGRFAKNSGESYGRGPGIDGFPDIKMANAQSEEIIRAAEISLRPPLAVLDDGTLGTKVIDRSAGAVNVLSFQGRLPTNNPISPLFTVGESRSMQVSLTETRQKISQHFLLDRLLDFSNETRMTAYETSVRERIRGESLSSIFNRQISEMFDPLIKKTFNVLFKRGFLGGDLDAAEIKKLEAAGVEVKAIPQKILDRIGKNQNVYGIKYISPAVRIMEKEEVTSAMGLIENLEKLYPMKPEVIDVVNTDKLIKLLNYKTGGGSELMNADDEVTKVRKARSGAVDTQVKLENMSTAAGALQTGAQAVSTLKSKGGKA